MQNTSLKTLRKEAGRPAMLSRAKLFRAEDLIIKLTLAYWRQKGRCYRNAWSAWQKAEREVMGELSKV